MQHPLLTFIKQRPQRLALSLLLASALCSLPSATARGIFNYTTFTQPTFITQPANTTVTGGEEANFTIEAAGSPEPSIQWQHSFNGGEDFTDIPGEKGAMLSFVAAVSQNGFQYRAVLTNSEGTAVSDAATMTVNKPDSITSLNTSLNPAPSGRDVTFTAIVAPAPPATSIPTGTVQFFDNGALIGACTNVRLSAGQAACRINSLTVGQHSITVEYGGDSNFKASAGALAGGNPQVITGPPLLTPAEGLMRVAGEPVKMSQVATVSDDVIAPGSINVTAMSVPQGLSLTEIVNTDGIITAKLAADCNALTGDNTIVLRASDDKGLDANVNLIVKVAANPAPVLGQYNDMQVVSGCKLFVVPDAAPADNNAGISIGASATGEFSGHFEIDAATGVVAISGTGPTGAHAVTVTATDSCGETSQRMFTVTVVAPPKASTVYDFDGDRKADVAVYRRAATPNDSSHWFILRSSDESVWPIAFGQSEDVIVPGDYDGDGRTDAAVFRPSIGTWFTSQDPATNFGAVPWGMEGDIPVPGFYDTDGKMDIAVYRPSEGVWYINKSRGGIEVRLLGQPGDKVLPADYDGDGLTDAAVWREADGLWYIQSSRDQSIIIENWGVAGDHFVPGDYDGDGTDDLAVFRPSHGTWHIKQSGGLTRSEVWGQAGDVPVAADFDADGKADLAVFRPSTGTWHIYSSCPCAMKSATFGIETDTPVSSIVR